VTDGDSAQFMGWPITIDYRDNDGREPAGWLPEMVLPEGERPVVQVIDARNQVLYTVRSATNRFRAPVYSNGPHSVKLGRDKPDLKLLERVLAVKSDSVAKIEVQFDD
jgi:hypothetical protein